MPPGLGDLAVGETWRRSTGRVFIETVQVFAVGPDRRLPPVVQLSFHRTEGRADVLEDRERPRTPPSGRSSSRGAEQRWFSALLSQCARNIAISRSASTSASGTIHPEADRSSPARTTASRRARAAPRSCVLPGAVRSRPTSKVTTGRSRCLPGEAGRLHAGLPSSSAARRRGRSRTSGAVDALDHIHAVGAESERPEQARGRHFAPAAPGLPAPYLIFTTSPSGVSQ